MQASFDVLQDSSEGDTNTAYRQTCDSPDFWHSFSQPVNRGQSHAATNHWQSRLKVQGMHCSACAARVESALLGVPGVLKAQVNALTNRAIVTWNPTLTQPSRWLAAASDAGYALHPIHGVDALSQSRSESRTMLWRWLVAGFCMMQVMMYAWPNYSALPGEIDALSDSLLRWASWLLALPVVLFSSRPFFTEAWRSIQLKRITMDVPVALGIVLTFTVSTVAVLQPQGPWGRELYLDSLCMLVFFLLTGRWIEARLKQQVASDLEAAASQLPLVVQRLDAQGQPHAVALHSVNVGDVLLVRLGESFAVDGQVVQGSSSVDESLLTGESQAIAKHVGDVVVAGSLNLQTALRVRATAVGRDTRFAQIAQLMESSELDKPAVVQLADRVARPFLWVVLALALGALLYWWPQDPHRAVLSAIAVLIVTCPCALALAAPAAFLSSAAAMARNGLLTRKLSAIERMAQVTSVLFDKTGTLTKSQLQVNTVRIAAQANDIEIWQRVAQLTADSLHPVSKALHAHASSLNSGEVMQHSLQVEEVAGEGVHGRDQAGKSWRLGRASFFGLTEQTTGKWEYLCDDSGWLASFELTEMLRPRAKDAISELRRTMAARSGGVALVSGDQTNQVSLIAKELDFAACDVQATCRAQDKLENLQRLRRSGQVVAMVGDGINDAPVLAAADVSIALGHGASLAMVKSDFILTSEGLWPLAQLQPHAARTMRIVRQNLWWALAYNMLSVPLAWMGWLLPWMAGLGMAGSSLLVLINALRLRRVQDQNS